MKKPGTSNDGTGGQAIPIPQAQQTGAGGDSGMDWIGSTINQPMSAMQIKRDSEGQLKSPQAGGSSAAGVNGVAGAVDAAGQDASRARVLEFLQRHTAYELIPESNKVVVLDTNLPVRQAFHACYEQGIAGAPLWDERRCDFVGMIGAGDFIDMAQTIGNALASGGVSEDELDATTIATAREEKAAETGRAPRHLVSVRPEDSLHVVSLTLLQGQLAMAPVLSYGAHVPRGQTPSSSAQTTGVGEGDAAGAEGASGSGSGAARGAPRGVPQLLHLTNLAEVLACLVRHFRGVPSALPLFSQPIGALPVGTWTAALGGFRGSQRQPGGGGNPAAGMEGGAGQASAAAAAAGMPLPQLLPVKAILPTSSVSDAFRMMPGCGALPVVDEAGRLVDVYARSDVMLLAANHTYRRVALSEFTVAQALAAGRAPQTAEAAARRRRGARTRGGGGGGGAGRATGGAPAAARAQPGDSVPSRAHVHEGGHASGGRGGALASGRAKVSGGERGDGDGGGHREPLGRGGVPVVAVVKEDTGEGACTRDVREVRRALCIVSRDASEDGTVDAAAEGVFGSKSVLVPRGDEIQVR